MATLNKYRGLLQSMTQLAIAVAGDIADQVTYTQVLSTLYDPESGTSSNQTEVFTFNGIVGKFGETEVDSKVVVATDAKLTCAYLDLPIEPTVEDTLTITSVNGTATFVSNWKVVRTLGTPGHASWVIHIRRL